MTASLPRANLADVAKRIATAKDIVVTSHQKPDGDAMGSCLALARALTPRGTVVQIILAGPVESSLMALAGETEVGLIDHGVPAREPELIAILDTASRSQLEPMWPWLEPRRDRAVVLDHHPQGDDVASMQYVDTAAASTTQIVAALLDELRIPITGGEGSVAEALFAGLATDTGWFRFQNAGAAAFELAARLLRAGVNKSRLYTMLEEQRRPQRLALMGRAFATIELHRDGEIAVMSLRPEDFTQTGGAVVDLSGLVSEPLSLAGVRASVLLVQNEPGRTKISLRSKPLGEATLDVNAIAQRLDGGGHVHAAGVRLAMNLDDAKAAILRELQAHGSQREGVA